MSESYNVIIIGSGAAGFAAADYLNSFGVERVCIVTDDINAGTSRNAGSDKQTYYKPDLCSPGGDSVDRMAADLAAGGSMNGSAALAQAANSLRCFMHLVDAGVPFPTDEYGRFAGYKTDHDNTARATSAGPLTSKYMTEALEKKVKSSPVTILDGHLAVKLIVKNGVCGGVVCLAGGELVTLHSKAVIMCTGAPAGMFSQSVYPACQVGATGLAIEAGAKLANFQEWQYGIASTDFRWNLSGSYQQVIPRYVSVSPDGEEKEFLPHIDDDPRIFGDIFLKGYQWPFDYRKIDGSSRIDIFVSEEAGKGNSVFLDYTKNPAGFDESRLSAEAYDYLQRAGALGATPFERLQKLNPLAVKLYLDHGIDLSAEKLKIAVCVQHNNGGIMTDTNGETNVKNLYAVGEAAGHFGVYRPGGSALNDTQTGALLAAKHLEETLGGIEMPDFETTVPLPDGTGLVPPASQNCFFAKKITEKAGIIRDREKVNGILTVLEAAGPGLPSFIRADNDLELKEYFILRQNNICREALCRTILSSIEHIGSRGGCVCTSCGERFEENTEYRKYITVTEGDKVSFEPVDDIPTGEIVFEKLLKAQAIKRGEA